MKQVQNIDLTEILAKEELSGKLTQHVKGVIMWIYNTI
jgi:hypothetical protein